MGVEDGSSLLGARVAHGSVAPRRAATRCPAKRPESPSLAVARRAKTCAEGGPSGQTTLDASSKCRERARHRRTQCDDDARDTRPYALGRLKCSTVRGRRLATGIVRDLYTLDHSICNASLRHGWERMGSHTMSRVYELGGWPPTARDVACMTPSEVVACFFLCSDACVRSNERLIRFKHGVCARTSRMRVPSVCHCGIYVGFPQRLPRSSYWRLADGPMTSAYRDLATLRSYDYAHDEERSRYALCALQENYLVHTNALPDDDDVASEGSSAGSSANAVDEELYERVVRPARSRVEC